MGASLTAGAAYRHHGGRCRIARAHSGDGLLTSYGVALPSFFARAATNVST
jgi:hypothetical protein